MVYSIYGISPLKKFKKNLLREEKIPKEDEKLDENSDDIVVKQKFNVAYVPQLIHNLLSITKSLQKRIYDFQSRKNYGTKKDKCVIKFDRIRNTNNAYNPGLCIKKEGF